MNGSTPAQGRVEFCRDSAEQFDPDEMDRYRDIQNGWSRDKVWESEKDVLVIHAETSVKPEDESFIAHLRVVPEKFDRMFEMDRSLRLFLHPPGALQSGCSVDYSKAELWHGAITGVVRTELHAKNRGVRGQFVDAKYDIDVAGLTSIPQMQVAGISSLKPRTQVVVRVNQAQDLGVELYSLSDKTPISNVLASAQAIPLHDIDEDVARFFTADSLQGRTLLYRPASNMRHDVIVSGFNETVRSGHQGDLSPSNLGDSDDVVSYSVRTEQDPIDPFFFLSKYAVRRKRT